MFWTTEKLEKQIGELQELRYRDERPIPSFRSKLDVGGDLGAYPSEDGVWEELRPGDRWKGRDHYLWLAADIALPLEWKGRRLVGRFQFGDTVGGNIGGFESLLFLNGRPYQGVDAFHQEVLLPAELAGSNVSLRFRLWSGLNGYGKIQVLEHQLQQAALCWLDEDTDDLFYTASAIIETVKLLADSRPERHDLLAALDGAFKRLDWSRPGSEQFYASVVQALAALKRRLADMPKQHAVTVRCIGHTHIDVAWLWRLKHTREKAARSFSTVLRLMEQFPEYVFLQTQPQLYEYIKTDYPEIYRQIRERVKDGRWEAGGAMWLEADCNLTSGESLIRQILYGKRFFKQEFGTECMYLWLPDVFGYSWALPQILVKSGIKAFMTTKISWNQYNRMPHDTFYWRGMDGTRILTHFITTPEPGQDNGAFYYTYNGKVTPRSVQGIWEAYQDKPLNKELLLAYGHGDGGGGVNREMLEMRRRLAELPGLPHVTTGRADDYFEELARRVESTEEYVHTWDGELYLELHRGTFTSQAFIKRMNRELELLYREAEWLGMMGSLLQGDWLIYRQKDLDKGWKIILRNQFHDIIPGSSIREVYDDCREEYAEAERIGRSQRDLASEAVAFHPSATGVTVFNGAAWERTEQICVPALDGQETGGWLDREGKRLEAQLENMQWHIRVPAVPAMGYTVITFAEGQAAGERLAAAPFQLRDNGISTPYYEVAWNSCGQLTRLYDKEAGREVLAAGEAGNVFQVFEDKPKSRHEAWDIDIYYQQKMRVIQDLCRVEVLEAGLLRAAVRFEWQYMSSTIEQTMVWYADSRRIDFQTKVDWHEPRQLLKAAFPVNVRSTEATYDIQFGNVKRPTHWNTSWDYAKFETVGHQWADLSERDYGVSLLNNCKYGYDIKDHVMRLTLIKSALFPDPQADQGEHHFVYSLLPHAGDWYEGGTVQEAWALNSPLTWVRRTPARPSFSLFSISAGHVMIDAVKKAEDQNVAVLRLHEFAGKRGEVTISSDWGIRSWQECSLMEEPEGERFDNTPIRFDIKPYEIKTILVDFTTNE
ncbi:alpha-mannosidase [Paenibacillus sp. y28]|uniref:alpha-mannosidase n=1 Tax=Paenibacillus sp. y28 TaxID=3129110 RepID=UPI00301803B6